MRHMAFSDRGFKSHTNGFGPLGQSQTFYCIEAYRKKYHTLGEQHQTQEEA